MNITLIILSRDSFLSNLSFTGDLDSRPNQFVDERIQVLKWQSRGL